MTSLVAKKNADSRLFKVTPSGSVVVPSDEYGGQEA